jgi:hypothetical protein
MYRAVSIMSFDRRLDHFMTSSLVAQHGGGILDTGADRGTSILHTHG